jgi:hypothetical protein
MTIRKQFLVLSALSSVALMAAPLLWGSEEDEDRASRLATSALVRTADLPADPFSIIPLPWGADPLGSGSVEVRARRLLDVQLHGAPANLIYDVLMCNLNILANRCTVLGTVTVDSEGKARTELNLPAAGNTWATFFALTRGGMTHFVSGFAFLAMPPAVSNGAEVEVKGRVSGTNAPANIVNIQGFAPLIFVDAQTKFKGIDGLAELTIGTEVEVQGATRPDGNLQARELKVKNEKD